MIRRLSAFDLPGRLKRIAPAAAVQVAVGLVLALAAVAARVVLEAISPAVVPFAAMFPAILLATGLAGWRAGAVTLICGLLSWFVIAPHLAAGLSPASALVNLGFYVASGALVIAAAAAYRATALALRDSEERLDLATGAAQLGIWEWRLDTGEMIYSEEAKRICGFPADQPVTREMAGKIIHPEDWPVVKPHAERALEPTNGEPTPCEYRIVRPDGEVRWIYAMGRAVFEEGQDGPKATRFVGTMQDITLRKADEERLRLLAREVDHRANNLLAVVQGTVALSDAEDVQALKAVITGRVNALARAHQLLAAARWHGADLRTLVKEELLGFSLGAPDRVAMRGPSVALAPAAAQSLAMALHELATNAAKYGALSTPEGRVEVVWRRDDSGGVALRWRESGGPPVRRPTRAGLGTTLLKRALSGPTGGSTSLDWRPEGLLCEMFVPATAVEQAPSRGANEADSEPTV